MPPSHRASEIIRRLPSGPCTAVEVGVWLGELSEALLHGHAKLTLHMVDRWHAVPEDHPYRHSGSSIGLRTEEEMRGALAEARARTAFAGERAIIHEGESVEVALEFEDSCLDLGYIDADHRPEAALADLEAWVRTIRRGGWIGGHDYGHPEQGDVKQAVADYRAEHGVHARLELGIKRTWFWRNR